MYLLSTCQIPESQDNGSLGQIDFNCENKYLDLTLGCMILVSIRGNVSEWCLKLPEEWFKFNIPQSHLKQLSIGKSSYFAEFTETNIIKRT